MPKNHRNTAALETDCDSANVSIAEAARLMGVSQQFVRVALQRGILPIGCAVQITAKKYTYYISRAKLYEYIGRGKTL